MIPKWEDALVSVRSLLSDRGRLLVADFDTYSLEGNTIKDKIIRAWYGQDGVRIEAKSRDIISSKVFTEDKFVTTFSRFQKKLLGVPIPHYVACCVKKEREDIIGKGDYRTRSFSWESKFEEKKTD